MENAKNHSIYRKENVVTIMSNRFHECLEISLPSFDLNYTTEKKDYGNKLIDCYGIIGIVDLINSSYLIVITEVELSFILFKREIYKIKNVELILLAAKSQNGEIINDFFNQAPNKKEEEENKSICNNLKKTFSEGFYFSNKYDLANSFASHNQIVISKNIGSSNAIIDYDHITEGNRNFLANWKLINKLIIPNEKSNTRLFVSNCIYGNIESFSFEKKDENDFNEKIQIIVISRRNLMNFSLSNFKKGLTKKGFNSNFIETEVIMVYNNTEIYSHIFLSSYIPIFFRYNSTFTEVNMNKAFSKYFNNLIMEYNLLVMCGIYDNENDKKYLDIFRNFIIVNKVNRDNKLKYFPIKSSDKTIKNILKDSKANDSNILEILGFSNNNSSLKQKNDFIQIGTTYLFGLNDDIMNYNQYLLTHKIISYIYKNVSKSQTKITKDNNFIEGLQIIFQRRKINLIPQYNLNADIDSIKKQQRMLEIIFGKNIKELKEDYKNLREDYAQRAQIKIFIGSWNTGSTNLNKYTQLNLDSLLIPKKKEIIPDIYVVGFQEVVELNAGNIVLNIENTHQILLDWGKKIENSIQKVGNYKKLISMNLVGINLYCYVLEQNFDNITNLTKKYVKTGFGGAGNKGSCCINFNYYSSSISIACAHLAAGEKKNKQRLKEISEILEQKISSFIKPDEFNISIGENDMSQSQEFKFENVFDLNNENESNSYTFKESDIWFLFGDLNFRIDLDYQEFSQFIKNENNWTKIVEYDQFNKNQKASIEFTEIIEEDPIIHPPTYKYILFSDAYDYDSKDKNEEEGNINNSTNLSGKKRNPSWCDRIFFKKNSFITKDDRKTLKSLGYYNSVINDNFLSSDHRPIFNIFDAIVFKDDEEKMKVIEKEVKFNNKLNIKSSYFQKKVFAN